MNILTLSEEIFTTMMKIIVEIQLLFQIFQSKTGLTALVGPSGSGKSTCMDILSGLLTQH